ERRLQRELADLLRQTMLMATHNRAEDHRAAAELRRTQRTLAGAARTLLLIGLLGGALNVGDGLRLVRTLAALGQLPVHGAREDIAAHGQTEHLVGEVDLADLLIVQACERKLHRPYSFFSAAGSAAAFRPAGNGRSFGAGRFTASRSMTQ